MKDCCLLIVICIIGSCFHPTLSSYLGYPRIHFAGQFRSDCNTRNNDGCNYRLDKPKNSDLNGVDWNTNGTNEFEFVNTRVTAVVDESGELSIEDSIVGSEIIGNLKRPIAKLTDLDIGAGEHSILFGLNFGIRNDDENGDIAFHGKWTPNVLSQYVWANLKCYNHDHHGKQLFQSDFPQGGQAITTITDIDWNDYQGSGILTHLREMVGSGSLSVRVTMMYYTNNYPPYVARNATLGYVYGVIGAPSAHDTLNVPGSRNLLPTNEYPVNLEFDEDDLCYDQNLTKFGTWMNTAPVDVDMERRLVHLDLSNSLPTQIGNSLRSFGELYLGVLLYSSCVYILGLEKGGILYDSTGDLPFTSGVYTIELDDTQLDMVCQSPLVVVQMVDGVNGHTPVCGDSILWNESAHTTQILLREEEYFIRPNGMYAYQLNRDYNTIVSHTLYVTRFGIPVPQVDIKPVSYNNLGDLGPPIPADGIISNTPTVTTDENGYATFQFYMNPTVTIPAERHYHGMPCINSPYPDNKTTLPIEGQNYLYYFCIDSMDVECKDISIRALFHAFADIQFFKPYTWKKDIEPIFALYAHLSPIMHKILDLSSYEEVTKPENVHILNLSLRLDFNDPSYMPTTRDLSPSKRIVILEWLGAETPPRYDIDNSSPRNGTSLTCNGLNITQVGESKRYERCSDRIEFINEPTRNHPYFSTLVKAIVNLNESSSSRPIGSSFIKGRPLLGLNRNSNEDIASINFTDICTKESLMEQLQTAIQLEWATIPTYLTSLYTIVDGCNTEIYEIIQSVVMQEMLHMTISTNILIAMNGRPVIDSKDFTPTFPTKLPGGVLPGLTVHLDKLNISHIHDVFMAIEVPSDTAVGGIIHVNNLTIGGFYDEILDCIEILGNEIFDPSTENKQVKWPWKTTAELGKVPLIVDVDSAKAGIKEIKAQGEGAGPLDPDALTGDSLAHFFKFEEVVCGKKLEKINRTHFAYEGQRIYMNPLGVWPMRRDLNASMIPCHTNCYTESRAFHKVYRMLLRKLQDIFDGRSDDIFVAVELMESLQVHAKKLVYTRFNPDDPDDETTCGPVWDYDWPEDEC